MPGQGEIELDEPRFRRDVPFPFVADPFSRLPMQGGTDTSQGKVNILLQAYISKAYIEDFALVSDTGFVQQVRDSPSFPSF